MKTLSKILLAGLASLFFLLLVAFAVDRLFLAPDCPPCHSDISRQLPTFSPYIHQGLVNIPSSGMQFRARIAGFDNRDGEGVILLHGYPETSILWEPVMELLAKGGFRVIAFDQRGYSPGARPGSVGSYTIDKLIADVIAIADTAGFNRFHLVGHDWGGLVGWMAARAYPDRVGTWTALSMPHPDALRESLGESDQLLRSSYALFNWIPGLAELVLGFNKAAYLRETSWSRATPEQREEYIAVLAEPGALRGPLNWYRANSILTGPPLGRVHQPTLYVWGNQDESLGRVGAEKTADYVEGPYRFIKLWARHQLMAEKPEQISSEILSHLTNWPLSNLPSLPAEERGGADKTESCAPSKPKCLMIDISPAATFVRLVNRCEQHYTGTIRVNCTGPSQGSSISYKFALGPGSTLVQETKGIDFNTCYYKQSVCISTAGRKAPN